MRFLYCSLIGYLIGALNPSYFVAKIKGFDIRKKGSGNAGASNALILFGKVMGVICALLDIAKAFLVILLTETLFPTFDHAFAVTGTACIIGHIFPFYMKFRGGKGLACLGGMILKFDWRVFLIMLTIEIVIALVTDYICFVPITAAVAFPFIAGYATRDAVGVAIICIVSVVMLLKHVENLKRIRNGTEMHLSYLWKPKAELERIQMNTGESTDTVMRHFSGDNS